MRNLHIRFKRAHTSAAVFAHDKLEVIAARGQQKAGVVLDILAANLLSALHSELNGVAQMADRELAAFQRYASDIQGGVVFIFFLDKGNLRTWHDQRYREEIMRVIATEVCGAGVDGYICRRQI